MHYDDFIEKRIFDEKEVEKNREYLDKHRELIDDLDSSIPIIQRESVLRRLEEIYGKICPKEERKRLNTKSRVGNYGIYGIYMDDKLVYIGETTRSFEERFKEHKKGLEDNKE